MLYKNNLNYGFIRKENNKKFDEHSIIEKDINWASTIEFKGLAKNHCAAVCATNIILLFNNRYNFIHNKRNIFGRVHKILGNGPKFKIDSVIKKYLLSNDILIYSKKLKNINDIKEELDKNNPVSLLLAADLLHWHWVVAVGYRIYSNRDFTLKLVDSWHCDSKTEYIPNFGSKILLAKSYGIK